MSEAEKLVRIIIDSIEDKKGEDIISLNLRNINSAVCDYFIICQADNSTQIKSIADHITRKVKKELKENVWHIEGYENAQWVLLDYVNVVVHIFNPEIREYYKLEELWADAEAVNY
ncbi:MAG: ribosome silencing factor [Marinilabiliales bacterium]